MHVDDNIHGDGKNTSTILGKTILTVKRNLLLNIGYLICNTANYFNATIQESNSILGSYHVLKVSKNQIIFQTDRYDSNTYGGNYGGYSYTIFIASFS